MLSYFLLLVDTGTTGNRYTSSCPFFFSHPFIYIAWPVLLVCSKLLPRSMKSLKSSESSEEVDLLEWVLVALWLDWLLVFLVSLVRVSESFFVVGGRDIKVFVGV